MRRNHTLRTLAAGAGAAAVLLAAASPALALDNPPFEDSFKQSLIDQGYSDVTCHQSPLPGNERSVYFAEEAWGPVLREGNDWALVVLKVANAQEGQDWRGYGEANVYKPSRDGNITHVMLCQGDADGSAEPTEDPTDEPTATDEPTEDPTDEPTATDEPTEDPTDEPTATDEPTEDPTDDPTDEPTATDQPTETEDPTGPPVETDGISSGPNMALLGGAALVLAGAGAAGFAMRRRDGGAH